MGSDRRLDRERRTVSAMLRLHCAGRHGGAADLCPGCVGLEAYAHARIDRCPFGPAKPVCALCPIHCYRPDMRARVRVAMRYAGPRMLLRHPVLAVLHLLDGRRKAPEQS